MRRITNIGVVAIAVGRPHISRIVLPRARTQDMRCAVPAAPGRAVTGHLPIENGLIVTWWTGRSVGSSLLPIAKLPARTAIISGSRTGVADGLGAGDGEGDAAGDGAVVGNGEAAGAACGAGTAG